MKKKNINRTAGLILLAATASVSILSTASPYMVMAAEVSSEMKGTTITNTPAQGSLTIKKTDTASPPQAVGGAIYTAYKIMSLKPGAAVGEYVSYEVVPKYQALFTEKGITADKLGNYSASKLEALIPELEVLARGDQGISSQGTNAENGTTTLTLPVGWYLVVETATPEGTIATAPFLVAIPSTNNITVPGAPQMPGTEWNYHISASPKSARITVDKNIVNGQAEHDSSFVTNGTFFTGKNETAGVGDYVKYSVTASVPSYSSSYFHNSSPVFSIQDTMSSGLTIQNSQLHPIEIKIGEQVVPETEGGNKNYILSVTPKDTEEADLQITFTDSFLKNNQYKGKQITVTYYAQLNEKAVMGKGGNTNNVVLSIWDKPGHTITFSPEKDKDGVKPDTYVYTYGIAIEKISEDKGTALQGAEFKLFKDKEMNHVVMGADGKEGQITDASGSISFPRLDAGTYYLKEIKSPLGYSLLANPVKIEIVPAKDDQGKVTNGTFTLMVDGKAVTETSGNHVTRLDTSTGIATIAIENHKGFSLPETGGTGIYVIIGISMTGILSLAFYMMRSDKKVR